MHPHHRSKTATRSLLACALLTLAAGSARAALTIDIRAVSLTPGAGTVSADGKLVKLDGDLPALITLQVWAQTTNTAPTSPVFGMLSLRGSIISAPGAGGPGVFGSLSTATLGTPFAYTFSNVGSVLELTVPADGSLDLGSNNTTGSPLPPEGTFIQALKNRTTGGTQILTTWYASNLDPAGATFATLPSGYEFLMLSTTYSVSSLGTADGSTLLNWVIPNFTTLPSQRMSRAEWTDGDGTTNNALTNLAELFVGAPVQITSIPEPGSALLLGIGTLALLRIRQRRR